MSENDNWRAQCRGTIIRVRPQGETAQFIDYLTPQAAIELRDQLTVAIEEAKKFDDPFERWWASLPPHPQWPELRYITQRISSSKYDAKLIFERIRKLNT